jgi:hypothetical protein
MIPFVNQPTSLPRACFADLALFDAPIGETDLLFHTVSSIVSFPASMTAMPCSRADRALPATA